MMFIQPQNKIYTHHYLLRIIIFLLSRKLSQLRHCLLDGRRILWLWQVMQRV